MRRRFLGSYLLLVGLPVLLVIVLVNIGDRRFAAFQFALPPDSSGTATIDQFQLLTLLLQIAVILTVARLVGALFKKLGQPQVVGEMAAGIVLGPSLFGAVWPGAFSYVFPGGSMVYLNALSQVGLLLFMFMIGLEMDTKLLAGAKRTALLTSHTSIAMPFLFGVLLAWFFFEVAPPRTPVRFAGYALFMGTAMSITAFPVLARMIQERNLTNTRLGAVALACAATDDVTAWCILAVVVLLVRAESVQPSLIFMVGGSIVFLLVMIMVLRPLMRRVLARHGERDLASAHGLLSLLLVYALCAGWTTERLGLHALFGAFLAGAVLPSDYPVIRQLVKRLQDLTVVFLLPLFFAFSGLRTHIETLDPERWVKTLLIIAVAVLGKLGGSAIAARLSGMNWREATALGALMNTRGLMELVVLNIGLDIGVIPSALFAMMVVMAMATTLMTAPLLNRYEAH